MTDLTYIHLDCGQPCAEPELKTRTEQPVAFLREQLDITLKQGAWQ